MYLTTRYDCNINDFQVKSSVMDISKCNSHFPHFKAYSHRAKANCFFYVSGIFFDLFFLPVVWTFWLSLPLSFGVNRPLKSCDAATPYIYGSHLFPRGMTFLPGLHNQSIDETDGMHYIDFLHKSHSIHFGSWIFSCVCTSKKLFHTLKN